MQSFIHGLDTCQLQQNSWCQLVLFQRWALIFPSLWLIHSNDRYKVDTHKVFGIARPCLIVCPKFVHEMILLTILSWWFNVLQTWNWNSWFGSHLLMPSILINYIFAYHTLWIIAIYSMQGPGSTTAFISTLCSNWSQSFYPNLWLGMNLLKE